MEEPRQLKHYEILSRLGEGGMGVVYRARDTRLGRIVALKMLPEELAANEERSRRFEREARIVSTLSHPGIATLYDFDRDGETAFLTMELVEGSNLRQMLGQGPMPMPDVIECGVQVSDALAAAHRNGVTHRDLKPENIIVRGNHQPNCRRLPHRTAGADTSSALRCHNRDYLSAASAARERKWNGRRV